MLQTTYDFRDANKWEAVLRQEPERGLQVNRSFKRVAKHPTDEDTILHAPSGLGTEPTAAKGAAPATKATLSRALSIKVAGDVKGEAGAHGSANVLSRPGTAAPGELCTLKVSTFCAGF